MSDSPLAKSADADHPKQSSTTDVSTTHRPAPTTHTSDALRWLTYAALALALVGVVLGALAYFHPAHKGPVIVQQGGDAKANVCGAYGAAHKAVVINTHMQSPNPNDPVAELTVATSARLSLIGSGAYLRDRVEANSGVSSDIANAVTNFANTVEQLGINYLNQADAAVQDPLRKDLDSQITQLDKLCG